MKRSDRQPRNDAAKTISHKSLIAIVVVMSVLVIGVATALSMQRGQTQKATTEEVKAAVTNQTHRNYVTSNAAGQTVVMDRQTGQSRPLTADEARKLADGIKQLINQST